MDIELILDSAEIMAPGLKDTARRILEATAAQMDVSLEVTDVLARQTAGWPKLRITAASDEVLTRLDTGDVLADEGTLMTLARIGAQAIMTRAELEDRAQAT